GRGPSARLRAPYATPSRARADDRTAGRAVLGPDFQDADPTAPGAAPGGAGDGDAAPLRRGSDDGPEPVHGPSQPGRPGRPRADRDDARLRPGRRRPDVRADAPLRPRR